jgi:hypothetical protein
MNKPLSVMGSQSGANRLRASVVVNGSDLTRTGKQERFDKAKLMGHYGLSNPTYAVYPHRQPMLLPFNTLEINGPRSASCMISNENYRAGRVGCQPG